MRNAKGQFEKGTICLGSENGNWKGDSVSYNGLHQWVNKNIPQPERCQRCFRKIKLEASNNGKYTRDPKQWEWLCKICHLKKDGAIERVIAISKSRTFDKIKDRKRRAFRQYLDRTGKKITFEEYQKQYKPYKIKGHS